jgi:hypothetical protein
MRNTTTILLEDLVRGGKPAVDRKAGVIKGVKILGRESVNGRVYTEDAIRQAHADRLYEGVAVYTDHPAHPNDPRPVRAKFGRLVNVRVENGELFGDLEYLTSHADAPAIAEAAERMPDAFGLSHNAKGDGEEDRDGLFVVHRIVEVRSVDVVTEPATTRGFFEHRARTGQLAAGSPEACHAILLGLAPPPRRSLREQRRRTRAERRAVATPEGALAMLTAH